MSKDVLYHGYWIRGSPFMRSMWVEKDMHHICWCDDVEDGKRRIHEIVGRPNEPGARQAD
jgi:hypothetical protein